jgi:hypothetical protein
VRRILCLVILLAAPAAAVAQSSQFGILDLGNPYRGASPTALGTGGSFASFDGTSSLNPASISSLTNLTATFSVLGEWRSWKSPNGDASLRDFRFPAFMVGGPVRHSRFMVGIGFSSYADRDYDTFRKDTLNLGGQQVVAFDSIGATGGISDVRGLVAWRPDSKWSIGLGLHLLPGSNRVRVRRSFPDTSFVGISYRSELSYNSFGIDLGMIRRFGSTLLVAASVRSDGEARQQVDSLLEARIDLPYTLSGAVLFRPSANLQWAVQGVYKTWSGANSDFLRMGVPGSRNSVDLSTGIELKTHRTVDQLPLRIGVHYTEMPFALVQGDFPNEFGLSLGSGVRFAKGRGAIEGSLEEVFRSDNTGNKERATIVSIQVMVRP